MKPVHVIFPVLRGSRKFMIEKGRRWSVIEHLLLDAVSRKPGSAADFAAQSGLPRRIVVEAFVRLMRAGWVEITSTGSTLTFHATPAGLDQAPRDQLQAATIIQPRWRSFAIEQITGGVFRSRELDMRPANRVPTTTEDEIVIHLPSASLPSEGDLTEVFTAIEGEDELIFDVERSAEKLIERQAVVTVRDGAIEGLPARASPLLRERILVRAMQALEADAASKKEGEVQPAAPAVALQLLPQSVSPVSQLALYEHDDLIIDGPAHNTALERLIRNASRRILIHSTFVTDQRAQALLPLLLQAATKGVRTDIFWGQDDMGTTTASSRAAAEKLAAAICDAGRSDSIRVHPFSTNSHAKIAVADNGRDRWYALLGSCNWLAADFESFEASMRLRDPALVGQLIRKLAGLARGRPSIWHDLAIEMTVLGRRVENMPRGNGRTVPMRLLFSPDHARLTLEARDRAKKRVFALSHRLGIAGQPVTLLPILSAIKAKTLEAAIYYGRTTGPLSGIGGADLTRELARQGLMIRPVHHPRIHAKVLGWDDDALAVTSFNWLSADPPETASLSREIGVLVEAPRIADNFIRAFDNTRVD